MSVSQQAIEQRAAFLDKNPWSEHEAYQTYLHHEEGCQCETCQALLLLANRCDAAGEHEQAVHP